MEAKLQDLETPCIILEQTSLQGKIKYNEGTVILMVSTMIEKQAWDEQGKKDLGSILGLGVDYYKGNMVVSN